jgi:Tfp pilus assembly PilM family ATPase
MSTAHGSGRSWFASPPPPAAIEIDARRVSVVSVSSRSVTGYASEPLPPGLVTPALNGPNVHDAAALTAAVKAAVDRVSPRPRRAALILPDSVAKVSLVRFEKIPPKAQDLEQLIRWQVRKAAPFRIEDAQVSWADASDVPGGGREYFVVLARRYLIHGYERICEAAGVHAGTVDIVSTNLVNAVLATRPQLAAGDWLLVHTAADSSTLVVVRNGHVIFFRNRPGDAIAEDMGDLVHQTAMYYQDRLGGSSFARVVLSGSSGMSADAGARVRAQIEERVGVRVEPLDVRDGVTLRDRISAGPELLDVLAPAVGVLLRDTAPSARKGERVA